MYRESLGWFSTDTILLAIDMKRKKTKVKQIIASLCNLFFYLVYL